MEQRHGEIADALFMQHRDKQRFRPLASEQRSDDLDAAYRIQEFLQERFVAEGYGEIAGYKVALTSVAMQEFVGVDQPLAGAIFANSVHTSPVALDLKAFQHLGIECEIAVRLSSNLPGRVGGHDAGSVGPSIGAVMPAFELIEDRNADYDAIDAFSLVADNSWNGGIVLGAATDNWQALDLLSLPGTLQMNGKEIGSGKGADALGNPLSAVAWLADLQADRGHILKRGMIVMTGSIVPTHFPAPGESLVFSLGDLGTVDLSLDSG
jgi:2-keto-4-pentenoate hydratase